MKLATDSLWDTTIRMWIDCCNAGCLQIWRWKVPAHQAVDKLLYALSKTCFGFFEHLAMVLHDLAQIVPKVTQLDDGFRLLSISWCFRSKGWCEEDLTWNGSHSLTYSIWMRMDDKKDEELETTSIRLPKRKILGDCDLQMMACISSNLVWVLLNLLPTPQTAFQSFNRSWTSHWLLYTPGW